MTYEPVNSVGAGIVLMSNHDYPAATEEIIAQELA
jgi:hypothetical protein